VTEFRSRALQVLDRLYDFVGQTRGLNEFDLAGSVQPVHDFSRESELGSRGQLGIDPGFGYLTLGVTDTHVGAGAIRTVSDLYALFASISGFADFRAGGIDDHRLWFIDAFAGTDTGDGPLFLGANEGLQFNATTPPREVMVMEYESIRSAPRSGGLEPAVPYTSSNVYLPQLLPRYLPPGTIWNSFSNFSGAGVFRHFFLFWGGPLGAAPPGYS